MFPKPAKENDQNESNDDELLEAFQVEEIHRSLTNHIHDDVISNESKFRLENWDNSSSSGKGDEVGGSVDLQCGCGRKRRSCLPKQHSEKSDVKRSKSNKRTSEPDGIQKRKVEPNKKRRKTSCKS